MTIQAFPRYLSRCPRARIVCGTLNSHQFIGNIYAVFSDVLSALIILTAIKLKSVNQYNTYYKFNLLQMGFLWSWNHMISKKWKWSQYPATGDEAIQTRMLRDFKHFCANQEQRLSQFWDQCWELQEKAHGIDILDKSCWLLSQKCELPIYFFMSMCKSWFVLCIPPTISFYSSKPPKLTRSQSSAPYMGHDVLLPQVRAPYIGQTRPGKRSNH